MYSVYSGLKVLTLMLVLVLLTGCNIQALSQEINLQEICCEKIEVSLGDGENIDVQFVTKVDPEWVEYWYKTECSIDNIAWSKDYACLSHALDSAREWEEDFGNEGLYMAGSMGSFHAFNAVYISVDGDILNRGNWVFIEPQNGKIIQPGSDLRFYSFPIEVNLQYISYEGIWGIDPLLKIVWETNSSPGSLYKVDKAGNLMPL